MGIIYYFYKNKEDIFVYIVLEVFFWVIDCIFKFVVGDNYLQFVCEMVWYVYIMVQYSFLVELYFMFYNLLDIVVQMFII